MFLNPTKNQNVHQNNTQTEKMIHLQNEKKWIVMVATLNWIGENNIDKKIIKINPLYPSVP